VSRTCHYGCGATEDLRPYGPGGAWVCFPCAMATPEREHQTEHAFGALLDAADAPTGVALLTDEGPAPVVDPGLLTIVDEALREETAP
jgi:hypothetical protein